MEDTRRARPSYLSLSPRGLWLHVYMYSHVYMESPSYLSIAKMQEQNTSCACNREWGARQNGCPPWFNSSRSRLHPLPFNCACMWYTWCKTDVAVFIYVVIQFKTSMYCLFIQCGYMTHKIMSVLNHIATCLNNICTMYLHGAKAITFVRHHVTTWIKAHYIIYNIYYKIYKYKIYNM